MYEEMIVLKMNEIRQMRAGAADGKSCAGVELSHPTEMLR
jgi:hypothetical protein